MVVIRVNTLNLSMCLYFEKWPVMNYKPKNTYKYNTTYSCCVTDNHNYGWSVKHVLQNLPYVDPSKIQTEWFKTPYSLEL